MAGRSAQLKFNLAAVAASQEVLLGAPAGAKTCTIIFLVTADGSGAGTVKVQQGTPDGTLYVDVPGLVTDVLTVGQTQMRVLTFGENVTVAAGTNFDTVAYPISANMKLVLGESAGALTNAKVWVEFS